MDGQCVEHLIGEDDAIDRGRESRQEAIRKPRRGESLAKHADPPLVDVDAVVADIGREATEQRDGERPFPGAVLYDDERIGSPEGRPRPRQPAR